MRITFVLPDVNMGGGTKVLAIHAQRLQQRGHQVVVVATPTPVPGFNHRVKSWLKGSSTPPEVGNQPSHFDNMNVDLRILKRHRVITNKDVPPADVVIATWWETAEWVDGFEADKGAKAYFIQGYETYLHQADRMRATWKLRMQKIVVSKWLQQIAQYEYGDNNVCIVPNSVDLNQFQSPVRGKQQIPTIGMLYAHVEIKRCDLMLKAYELARRQIPNLRLVAFGNVPVTPELPLPQGAGYWKTPPQDQIKKVYAQCDAWLFGSSQEGFGLPVVEAMACRTPVIATPAGAAPELLAGGGGTLVKDGDPVDMARAIVDMIRMPEWNWREVSDAAYRTASGFTWEDSSKLFETALERAVEGKTGQTVLGNVFILAPAEPVVLAPVAAPPVAPIAAAVAMPVMEQPVVAAVVEQPIAASVLEQPIIPPAAVEPIAAAAAVPIAEPPVTIAPVEQPVAAPVVERTIIPAAVEPPTGAPVAIAPVAQTPIEQPVAAAPTVTPSAFSETPFVPPVEPIVAPESARASIFVPPAEPVAASPLAGAFAPTVAEPEPIPAAAEAPAAVVAEATPVASTPAATPEAVTPEQTVAPTPAVAPVAEQKVEPVVEAPAPVVEKVSPPEIPAASPTPETPAVAPSPAPAQPTVEAPAPPKAPTPPPAKPPTPTVPISAKPRLPLITAKPRTPQPAKEHKPAASSVSH